MMKVVDLPWCYPKVIGYVVDLFIESVQRFWVLGSGLEQRTAEYRISNRRMSKGGIASLSHFFIK
jgi:hypothetical protein